MDTKNQIIVICYEDVDEYLTHFKIDWNETKEVDTV